MALCNQCSRNPCCCPDPHPVPAPPVISVESNPAAIPECPNCPPVIHETLDEFVVPALDQSVEVKVCDAEAWPVSLCVDLSDGNESAVMRIVSRNLVANTITLQNEEFEDTIEGIVLVNEVVMVLKGLCPKKPEKECHLLGVRTIGPVIVPAIDGQATVELNVCVFLKADQVLYLEGFGCLRVVAVVQEEPNTIFIGEFYDLYGNVEGTSIPSGFVTTADMCGDYVTKEGLCEEVTTRCGDYVTKEGLCEELVTQGCQSAGKYLGSDSATQPWIAEDNPQEDPDMELLINVAAGDTVRIEGNATLFSPRNSLRFQVTGTSNPTQLLGQDHFYEDGFNLAVGGNGPGTEPDANPHFTAYQMEVWQASVSGELRARWFAGNEARGGPPAVNITNRTLAAFSA